MFPPGFNDREGDRLPLIVRKSDGGYGYATTDFATVRYWVRERKVDELIYVVGTPRRSLHFQMIFATSKQAGWLDDAHTAVHTGVRHDPRGRRQDHPHPRGRHDQADRPAHRGGRAGRTRCMPETSEVEGEEKGTARPHHRLGAVKYADLCNDREKDYVFTWEKMLAKTGDTSVYIQYANARTHLHRAQGRTRGH